MLQWRHLSTVLVRSVFTFAGQRIVPRPSSKKPKPVDVDAVVQAIKEAEGIRVHHKGHLTAAVFGEDPEEGRSRRRKRRYKENPKMGPRERYMFKKLRQRERERTQIINDPASDLGPLYEMMQPWMGYSRLKSAEARAELQTTKMWEPKYSKNEHVIISKIRDTIDASQSGKKMKMQRNHKEAEMKLLEISDRFTTETQSTNKPRSTNEQDSRIDMNLGFQNKRTEMEDPVKGDGFYPQSVASVESNEDLPKEQSPSRLFFLNADDAERHVEKRTPKVADHVRSSLTEQLATRIHRAELISKRSSRQSSNWNLQRSENSKLEMLDAENEAPLTQALVKDPTFKSDALKFEAESNTTVDVEEWISQLRSFAERHGDVLEAMDETKERHLDTPLLKTDLTELDKSEQTLKESVVEDGIDIEQLETEAKKEFEEEFRQKPQSMHRDD